MKGCACVIRCGGNDADEFAGLIKAMQYAVTPVTTAGGVIEDRDFIQVGNPGHVLPHRKSPQSRDISDHAEVDGCQVQSRMKVFHDKQAFAGGRNVFTEFLPLTLLG